MAYEIFLGMYRQNIGVKNMYCLYYLRFCFRAYCVEHWYNVDCHTYCVAQNNSNGHYTCDKKTGSKLCNSGWTGADCLQGTSL